jgi:hypothetical protein
MLTEIRGSRSLNFIRRTEFPERVDGGLSAIGARTVAVGGQPTFAEAKVSGEVAPRAVILRSAGSNRRVRKADLEGAADTHTQFIFRSAAIAHRAANSC